MPKAANVIIVQRVIPHYRVELFRRLNEQYGVKVVAAERPPGNSFLSLANPQELPFAVAAPFVFPDAKDPFRVEVPVNWILSHLGPQAIIAEFGLRMSSSYSLPWRRRTGALERLAFWTHGWQMERGFNRLADRAVQFGRLPLYAMSDVIATYTNEGADWVRKRLPRHQVIAVGNALDTEAIARAAAASRPVRHGQPQLLAAGRLTREKGFDKVIDVFRRVRDNFPNAGLTIIGEGPERERLEALAGDLLGGAIRMPGQLYDERDLAPHFIGAEVFVLPGAAGLSVNHALAYGLPIIAFARMPDGPRHHPEIEYLIDGVTGISVKTRSLDALAEQLTASLSNGTLDKLRVSILSGKLHPTLDHVVSNFGKLLSMLNASKRTATDAAFWPPI